MLLDRLPLGASAPGSVLRNTKAFTGWLGAGWDPGPRLVLVLAVTQTPDWELCLLRVTASHGDSRVWV